jgi:hypothetical protein
MPGRLGMFGEKKVKLITIQCACCGKWHVVRVDPDDLERHVKGGIYVQHAFADRDGKPYLSPYSRELFISKCCRSCWRALCPSDPLAYN